MRNVLSLEVTELKEVIVGFKVSKREGGYVTKYKTIAPGDDYSALPPYVKNLCEELHTPEVISAYQLSIGG